MVKDGQVSGRDKRYRRETPVKGDEGREQTRFLEFDLPPYPFSYRQFLISALPHLRPNSHIEISGIGRNITNWSHYCPFSILSWSSAMCKIFYITVGVFVELFPYLWFGQESRRRKNHDQITRIFVQYCHCFQYCRLCVGYTDCVIILYRAKINHDIAEKRMCTNSCGCRYCGLCCTCEIYVCIDFVAKMHVSLSWSLCPLVKQ